MTLNDLGMVFGVTLVVEKTAGEPWWKARFNPGNGTKLMVRGNIHEARWEPTGIADTPSGACRSLANELSFKSLMVPIVPRSPEGGTPTTPGEDWSPRLLGDPGTGCGLLAEVVLTARGHEAAPFLQVDLPEVFHVEPQGAAAQTTQAMFRAECDLRGAEEGH
jgi:hypothetical protein